MDKILYIYAYIHISQTCFISLFIYENNTRIFNNKIILANFIWHRGRKLLNPYMTADNLQKTTGPARRSLFDSFSRQVSIVTTGMVPDYIVV